MQNRILVAFGIILFGLVCLNTWNMNSLQTQLDSWEDRFEASPEGVALQKSPESVRIATRRAASGSIAANSVAARGSSGFASDKAMVDSIDLENPEVREKIAEIMEVEGEQRKAAKRKEQSEMYMDSMVREIDTFAQEYGLDARTKASVVREVEASSQAFNAVRNDVRDGKISWFDAKEEFGVIKEDTGANLRELLGDEQYDELKGRLWGGWGGRK
jgi:hypothetical protein